MILYNLRQLIVDFTCDQEKPTKLVANCGLQKKKKKRTNILRQDE